MPDQTQTNVPVLYFRTILRLVTLTSCYFLKTHKTQQNSLNSAHLDSLAHEVVLPSVTYSVHTDYTTLDKVIWTLLSPLDYYNGFKRPKVFTFQCDLQKSSLQKQHIAGGGPSTLEALLKVFFCEILQCIGYSSLDADDHFKTMSLWVVPDSWQENVTQGHFWATQGLQIYCSILGCQNFPQRQCTGI